jgi:hypothetical protein
VRRHGENSRTSWPEYSSDLCDGCSVIGDVLEDVGGYNNIKNPGSERQLRSTRAAVPG